MALDEPWDEDLQEITDDLSVTVYFEGDDYQAPLQAIMAPLPGRMVFEDIAGAEQGSEFVLVMRSALFSSAPSEGQFFKIDSVFYIVIEVVPDETGVGYDITVKRKDR